MRRLLMITLLSLSGLVMLAPASANAAPTSDSGRQVLAHHRHGKKGNKPATGKKGHKHKHHKKHGKK